nr:FAD-binding and (Fe-S)-binding domain-containing protein [Allosaccharopolyspora coralli]
MRRDVAGTVALDAATRALYTTDASNYRAVPDAVLVPRSTDDVVAALASCHEFGVPVVNRGGGTSVAGNALGGGLLIDTSRHLTAVSDIDPESKTARVEPGVVLDDLRAAAGRDGLTFGPDPSTHGRCTVGGMIGNNACGSHSVAWGTTADNVESLDIALPDGTRMTVGATSREQLRDRAAAPNRQGQVYARLQHLVDRHLATIRTGLPTFSRRVSGYALDQLLPEKGFHLARALTGTEGSCVSVLGATVRLVESPKARALLVLGYPDAPAAGDAVPEILRHRPLTVEGLDRELVDTWRSRRPSRLRTGLPNGRAWLLVEFGGDDLAEAESRACAALASLSGAARGEDTRVLGDVAKQRAVWRIREEGAGIATRLPDGSEAWPGLEDAAVPPDKLGSYLRGFDKLKAAHGRRGVAYGHFGEGCLHVRLDFDMARDNGIADFRTFMEDAAELIHQHGGSLSGEHGDGRARSELLARTFPDELVRAFGEFKAIWDPAALMNPGVIVEPAPLDADLRVPSLSPPTETTAFSYPEDGGSFSQAVGRCVGVGKCRQSTPGNVMCPSFQVTAEERHSTRGRAHLLGEMLAEDVITDGWRSEEVREALDLCLSCKGCRTDCPVNVDMATYKSEFLHHHYAKRLRPASHYSMGWLPLWARLASVAPRVVNAVGRHRATSTVLKRLGGIAPERTVPIFAAESFTRGFGARSRPSRGRSPVALWPDTFTNYLAPEVGHAAVKVMEDAGFNVLLPDGPVCCGLTWVSTGQLDVAKRVMRRSLSSVEYYASRGVPIVGLEPSCTAALRTDVPELLATESAHATAGSVFTFAEFLERHAPGWTPPHVHKESISQVHCHQHAVTGYEPDEKLLRTAGVDNTRLDSGCCGLAGNFGFERGHYEVSQACGEQALLPAVREADADTLVLADGFSCRTQIEQATGRRAAHVAEILADALPRK